jgi:hypothetical protein
MDTNPSLAEWKELYQASIAFKDLRPWTHVDSRQMFAIQNPEDGEMGYCFVMGGEGRVLGLSVHLGTEGWDAFRPLLEGKADAEDPEFFFAQKALMVSFVPASKLDETDNALMRQIGMVINKKTRLPLFRSYEPGYLPWYLTGREARFLTTILVQAEGLLQIAKSNQNLFAQPEPNLIFSRVCKKNDGNMEWFNQWLRLPKAKSNAPDFLIDEIRMRRILHNANIIGPWEVDIEFTPHVISESGRPTVPRLMICVDQDTGSTVFTKFATQETYQKVFIEAFIETIETYKRYPIAFFVRRKSIAYLLDPLADKLKIGAFIKKELSVLEEAKERNFDLEQ